MKGPMLPTRSSFSLVFQRKTTKEIKLHLTLSRDVELVLSERHLPKPLTYNSQALDKQGFLDVL